MFAALPSYIAAQLGWSHSTHPLQPAVGRRSLQFRALPPAVASARQTPGKTNFTILNPRLGFCLFHYHLTLYHY